MPSFGHRTRVGARVIQNEREWDGERGGIDNEIEDQVEQRFEIGSPNFTDWDEFC